MERKFVMKRFIQLLASLAGALVATIAYAWLKSGGMSGPDLILSEFGVDTSLLAIKEPLLIVKQVIIYFTFFLTLLSWFLSGNAVSLADSIYDEVNSLLKKYKTAEYRYYVSEDRSFKVDANSNGERIAELAEKLKVDSTSISKDLASVCDKFENTISISESLDTLNRQEDRWSKTCVSSMVIPQFAKVTLPLIGFAGTIFGIMGAMGELERVVNSSQSGPGRGSSGLVEAMIPLIQQIGVAFDTTLIALFGTAALIYRVTSVRSRVSLVLDNAAHLIARDLVNSFRLPQLGKTIDQVLERIAVGAIKQYAAAQAAVLAEINKKLTGP
jgi:hypothetical protein